jgi:hypothetical protein
MPANQLNIPLYILLTLTIIILFICIYNRSKYRELFTATAKHANNPIVNLPGGDIHFISDNNPELIDIPVFNYALKTESKTAGKYITVFHHKPFDIYKGIGQYVVITNTPFKNPQQAIKSILDKKCINYLTSSPIKPIGYNLIWTSDLNNDNKIFSVWSPIPPAGCMALGDIIIMGTEPPSTDMTACYPITMLEKTALSNGIIWKAGNDMGKMCYCWGVGNLDTYKCSNSYSADMPELQSVYNLPTSILNNNVVGDNVVGALDDLSNHQKKIQGITV